MSERKRREAALRDRELQTLADNSPDILTQFDRELRHVFVNAAVEKATGRSRESFLGRTNREMGMPPDRRDAWDAALRSVFETGRGVSSDFSYETSSGERHYSARFVPETGPSGHVEFVLGVTRDVTDKVRDELALRAGEERLRMALNAARAGAWAWEAPTGSIAWSPENYVLYGLDPDAGPPSYGDWEARIHPDDRDGANADVRDALEGRTPGFRSEFRVVDPIQGVRWLLGLGRVDFGPDGKPLRMIGINLDVTDRKRFEQAMADQDRRKNEFLATLAHELRNPLAPIRTGLQVLKLAPPNSPMIPETRVMMERQLGHMVRLIDDLLDVSRISRGRVELKRERVRIRSAIEHALEVSRPLIDAAGHQLTIAYPDDSVYVDGDLTRLTQVVGNVLNNAAKYTPDGGRIELSSGVEAGRVVIRVADDGAGITAEMLVGVFDLFAQVDQTLDWAQGGLGIGLSLVKKILELHGGTIEAASPGLGLGSTFTIRLPLATVPKAVDAPAPGESQAAGPSETSSLRVLVVDDSLDGAQSLAMLVRMWGHTPQTAHDGSGAIAAAADHRPELVFLDIGLPGMDGYEVCRRLRSDPKHSGATFVALTGWGSEAEKRRVRDAGLDHHLVKPIDPDLIREVEEGRGRAEMNGRSGRKTSQLGGPPGERGGTMRGLGEARWHFRSCILAT
ncbi:PAS domain-containing hybrid sensor histidine kinase/response regulator [Paludisphaera mucosa]|uniref:histidine kinase n=1 Tax=Paludisphaera mucosa TaxID=3030827 RepID=A0ABT6FE79_9BACT|nr:ATP-binding protein [Paludisphaera mucosa]MDG3005849.1 ATP-binding protein [Paludisphaera mucosa]